MRRSEQDSTGGAGLDDLAEVVRRRRETLPTPDGRAGVSIKTAAGSVGMSHITWQRVEAGNTVRRLSYAGVERALGWEPGSIDAYLTNGIEPPNAPDATPPPASTTPPPVAERQLPAASEVPSLLDATHDQLLGELRRRLYHLTPSAPVTEQRSHLAEATASETAESVEARGAILGLPLDEGEDSDATQGGQA